MAKEFLLASLRDSCGSNVAFPRENGKGYTTDIDEAHVYSESEAMRLVNTIRDFECFLRKDVIDNHICWKVDSQLVNSAEAGASGPFVAYKKRLWDGNDLYFIGKNGTLTTSIHEACEFDNMDANLDTHDYIQKEVAEKVKRATFASVFLVNAAAVFD